MRQVYSNGVPASDLERVLDQMELARELAPVDQLVAFEARIFAWFADESNERDEELDADQEDGHTGKTGICRASGYPAEGAGELNLRMSV
ncbi:MAG TPA: hypothetical protein VH601_19270 [Bryobacteraceae bacterium]|jgi:hypothetical protein